MQEQDKITKINNGKNIEERILQEIKEKNLRPKSVWYFLIKDYSLWGAVALSVILGAVSIAPILFIFDNLELQYIKHITSNIFKFILITFPYPWIVLCLISIFLAKISWNQTNTGYKFEGKYVVIISILTSLILGIILNVYTFGKLIDEQANQKSFGYYQNMESRMQQNWFNIEQGRLIGTIQKVSTTSFFLYNEQNNLAENIYFEDDVPGFEYIEKGNVVRVIGLKGLGDDFTACAIFPDNFILSKERVDRDEVRQKLQAHPECKVIIDDGRANFIPTIATPTVKTK